jgi:hypothetical protein
MILPNSFYSMALAFQRIRSAVIISTASRNRTTSCRFATRIPAGGGLIGALINGRMAEIDRLRMRNASMRKCMGMMGYERYQVPQEQWKALVKDGDIVVANGGRVDPEIIENMVDFATGPKPMTERLPL